MLAVLKPFLNEIAFYAKLSGRFSGANRLEVGTNIQLTNLELLLKFHVCTSSCFRVISKSLKLRTR